MNLAIKRLEPVKLRAVGLDERWLQQRIIDDPEILGLGQLEIASREHRQPYGGRIDFLMRDAEGETYYAVEVMLGALDESHIIRTLEYWDLERQRRPQLEHRAVIVAEEITGRFFNVIRLLNRAVPIIAVQLTAVKLNDNDVGLLPVTVLDVLTEFGDPAAVAPEERVDRPYWETKVPAASLSVVDKIVEGLRTFGAETRIFANDVGAELFELVINGRQYRSIRPSLKGLSNCRNTARGKVPTVQTVDELLNFQWVNVAHALLLCAN
jgi:hypothetical protein